MQGKTRSIYMSEQAWAILDAVCEAVNRARGYVVEDILRHAYPEAFTAAPPLEDDPNEILRGFAPGTITPDEAHREQA